MDFTCVTSNIAVVTIMSHMCTAVPGTLIYTISKESIGTTIIPLM